MPICDNCGNQVVCTDHMHIGPPLGEPVLPCQLKCSIWVQAIDTGGLPVAGLKASIEDGATDTTKENGFAKLEDLAEKKHTVTVALTGKAAETFALIDPQPRKETLKSGDLKLLMVKVRPRVQPQLVLGRKAVAVGGDKQTLTLKTDIAYSGPGTLTCLEGAEHVIFDPPLEGNTLKIPSLPEGGKSVTIEARTDSKLDGVRLRWEVDPALQRGDADEKALTVVKAWLEPHAESGPLEESVKKGAGLLLHLQNDAGERPRAKVLIKVLPAAWKGTVTLAAANGKATLWDADRAGNAVNLDQPVKVGPGERDEFFLEGKAPSADPLDGAMSLAITDLSQVVDSFHATVVKAWLEVHRTTGALLDPGVMKGDGLLVHVQNPAGERRRAKVNVRVEPARYTGLVNLTLSETTATLFAADRGGAALDLGPAMAAGEYFIEGIRVSATKQDTELTLKVAGLGAVIDRCKITVIETKLVSYEDRVGDRKADPLPVADDKKLDPGRTLVTQTSPRPVVQRTKLLLKKAPFDAPCKVTLKCSKGGAKINLFPALEISRGSEVSFENPREGETAALSWPRDFAPDGIVKEGVVFWVEGTATGALRETELQVDVDAVDERCDAIAYTVADPILEILVVRHDAKELAADVTVRVTPIGATAPLKTATVNKWTGQRKLSVPAGHYVVTLEPQDVNEAKMRVNRLVPDDARQAAVALLANAPVKLELAPPYTEVQFIAYWQTTGVYKGTDQPCALDPTIVDLHARAEDFKNKWKVNSMGDIEGRCNIMVEAIDQAHARPEVKKSLTTDRHVLKVFMAPEFYFRGQQGVYPFEAVSEILNVKALRDKMNAANFRDWLFVLGSAIGAIEGGGGREKASYEGDVTGVLNGVRLKISCQKASLAAAMTASWKLAIDKSGGAWTAADQYSLFNVTKSFVGTANAYLQLGVNGIPSFDPTQKMKVSATGSAPWHDVTFADDKMTIFLITTPKPKTPVPVVGWTLDIGTVAAATIVNVTDKSGGSFEVEADVPTNFAAAIGKFKVNDPGGLRTEYPNCVIKSVFQRYAVHIKVPTGSPEAAVAIGWKLRIDTSGAGTFGTFKEHNVTGVQNRGTFGATDTAFDLFFGTNPTFDKTQSLALHNGGTIYQVVGRREPTKIVRLIVTTNGARPGLGWAIEGAVQGAIINVVQLAARDFLLDVGTKLDTAPAANAIVQLVEPGETEIINIAPVYKGGAETPVGADGRALKEMLVYKETISSVDFTTLDYGSSDFFYRDVRHLIQAYADQSRRALPTVGSTDSLATSPNQAGTTSSSGYRVSEVSISGIGGGTVFTMDKITFGLEVCLDQNAGRLEKYYGNPAKTIPSQAKAGEPKVQVQLIPSCGAGINNPCTVPDGPIFNVDVDKHGAKINGGGGLTDINNVEAPFAPPLTNVATYFETGKNAGTGQLAVYDPVAIPAPAKVP